MTAIEELMALVQNYAVTAVEFLGSQRGVLVTLVGGKGAPVLAGEGVNAEEAAAQLLDMYRRKRRPTNAPTTIERRT